MKDRVKGGVLFGAGMAVLLYGIIAMIGYGLKGGEVAALAVWAIVYGSLMAGSSHYDTKGGTVVS